ASERTLCASSSSESYPSSSMRRFSFARLSFVSIFISVSLSASNSGCRSAGRRDYLNYTMAQTARRWGKELNESLALLSATQYYSFYQSTVGLCDGPCSCDHLDRCAPFWRDSRARGT